MNNREIRAYSILAKGDTPNIIDENTFTVPSQSGNGEYKVTHKQEWSCECKDFKFRGIECKHIKMIKFFLKFKGKSEVDSFFEQKMKENNQVKCVYCNSKNIIKRGIRKNKNSEKQRYLCKDCNRKFIADSIHKIKGNEKIVALIMDCYFRGFSLRDIKQHLNQFYNIKLTHVTIYRWVKRFTKIMNDYVDKIQPSLSGKWQADEQMIKSKGKYKWCWNIIDEDTRFLIANEITKTRNLNETRKVFKKAKKIAKEKPEYVKTDGLQSYEKAIKKELMSRRIPRTKHIRHVGIGKKENNNKVERYHSSFRERDKVMRGFKGQEDSITKGFRTYYNFVRSHQALDGMTPSQMAKINEMITINSNLKIM